jgi:hypothetical protein
MYMDSIFSNGNSPERLDKNPVRKTKRRSVKVASDFQYENQVPKTRPRTITKYGTRAENQTRLSRGLAGIPIWAKALINPWRMNMKGNNTRTGQNAKSRTGMKIPQCNRTFASVVSCCNSIMFNRRDYACSHFGSKQIDLTPEKWT